MLDEGCHLLAERPGVFLAEIDLVLCAADAELQRLGCRASIEIVFGQYARGEYRRIHGELAILGVKVAASTVWEILKKGGRPWHRR